MSNYDRGFEIVGSLTCREMKSEGYFQSVHRYFQAVSYSLFSPHLAVMAIL